MRKNRFVILLVSLLLVLSLASCKKKKINHLGVYTNSDDGKVLLGCNTNINNKINKSAYFDISYARSEGYEFDTLFSLYYFTSETGATKIMDCDADFGHNKKRIAKYIDRIDLSDDSFCYRAGFKSGTYVKLEIDYTKFTLEEGTTYLVLCDSNNIPTSVDDLTKVCNVGLTYKNDGETLQFTY